MQGKEQPHARRARRFKESVRGSVNVNKPNHLSVRPTFQCGVVRPNHMLALRAESRAALPGEWALPSSHCGSEGLLTNAQLSDDIEIPLRVFPANVIKQTSAPTHQSKQSTARRIVFAVRPHVFGQTIDPLGQDGNLHLG